MADFDPFEDSRLNAATSDQLLRALDESFPELPSAEFLSQVVEQGPGAVIITNSSSQIEYVNRRFTEQSGYSLEEVIGQSIGILKSPATSTRSLEQLKETLRSGRIWHGELEILRKDQTPYWVQTSISPLVDHEGKVVRHVAQQIDISDRKAAELVTQRQNRFQRFLAESNARLVSVGTDTEATALQAHLSELVEHFQADEAFFGFLHAEDDYFRVRAQSRPYRVEDLPVFDWSGFPEWLRSARQKESIVTQGQPLSVPWNPDPLPRVLAVPLEGGKGDSGLLVLWSARPLPTWTPNGIVAASVVANTLSSFLGRMIAEQRLIAAQKEAERANRAKSDYLAHISHEIRTPMNGILGLAELALGKPVDAEVRSLIEAMKSSGEALLDLVNDILDLSKIESGMLELEDVPFSLRATFDLAIANLRVLATRKGLDLHVHVDPELPDQRGGDPTRLRQVITNLIGNAIKFTAKGSVDVELSRGLTPEILRVSVRDTGPGVPPAQRDRLFLRFSQTNTSVARTHGGTGLGLAICRELVEAMRGEIGYREVSQPPGSEFWFWVPLPLRDVVPIAPLPPAEPSSTDWVHLRILVVEDNLVNQKVATGLLTRWHIHPTVASNGMEALDKMANHTFDIVLMDVQMPVLDGYATSQAIRRGEGGERHRTVPIIAMTANAMKSDREAAYQSGMSDYLTKPVSAVHLSEILLRWAPSRLNAPEPLAIFDEGEMRSRLQLDDETVLQILELFLEDLPLKKRALEEAFKDRAAEPLSQLAHTLKGTAANLVAPALVDCAQRVEDAACDHRVDDFDSLSEELFFEIDRLYRVLTHFISQHRVPS